MPRSMRAPCSSSTVTISELPIQLAMCSGVELSLRGRAAPQVSVRAQTDAYLYRSCCIQAVGRVGCGEIGYLLLLAPVNVAARVEQHMDHVHVLLLDGLMQRHPRWNLDRSNAHSLTLQTTGTTHSNTTGARTTIPPRADRSISLKPRRDEYRTRARERSKQSHER